MRQPAAAVDPAAAAVVVAAAAAAGSLELLRIDGQGLPLYWKEQYLP